MNTTFKTLLSSTVLVAAGLVSAAAFAQTPPPAGAPGASTPGPGPAKAHGGMKMMDTNGDKMISKDEAKGHKRLEKNFDAIDANKDGQITRDEMKAFRAAHKGERTK